MIVEKETLLRVMIENQEKLMSFRFYYVLAVQGIDKTDLMTYESLIPAGTLKATYAHRPEVEIDAVELVKQEWESIAYFMLDGTLLCKREAYGKPMISRDDEQFSQSLFKSQIEAELTAQNNPREIVIADMDEQTAGSLMSDYAKYWDKFKKDNLLSEK
ncbi:hypothetical protein GHI93_00315 [Lactococcus hircilactis]|uniref:Uncharacterized protein n=1 Tax=Lactococcus hircilactis TaxID=1494462 RepID=A0A7X2CZJ6_9LACT|nr:hypothetical protein [Lactococcus hircilactis]MQW38394.1 hypothetical protein [Lactococcus hircilactis]